MIKAYGRQRKDLYAVMVYEDGGFSGRYAFPSKAWAKFNFPDLIEEASNAAL